MVNIIKNMYQNIKSCVYKNGTQTFFMKICVRQGETLHSLLFAVFLNDLEQYLEIAGILSLDMTDSLF